MIKALLSAVILLLTNAASAQVVLGPSGSFTSAIGDVTLSGLNQGSGINISSNANRCVIAALWFTNDPGAITSASFGGVTMTDLGTANTAFGSAFGGGGSGFVKLFGLANPATASSPNITVSWANSVEISVAFAEFDGCDQTGGTTTFKNWASASGNATGVVGPSIVANNNDGLVGILTENRSGATATQTSILGGIFAGANVIKDYSWATASGTTTVSWNLAGTDQYAIAGVAIKVAGGAAAVPQRTLLHVGQ